MDWYVDGSAPMLAVESAAFDAVRAVVISACLINVLVMISGSDG